MDTMKILQIHNEYLYSGGEDAVVWNEFELLKKQGLEVRQLLFKNEQLQINDLFYNRSAYQKVLSVLDEFEPDVVHVHNLFYKASPSVLNAVKSRRIPVVLTLHNFRLICPAALLLRNGETCTKCVNLTFPIYAVRHACFQKSYVRSLVLASFLGYSKIKGVWRREVDKYIVLTPFIKGLFENSSLGVEADKIIVKPNSADDLQGDEQPNLSNRRGFLYIGRLSEEKGVNTLIDAFNGMPDKTITIIGTGPLESELKKRAKKNVFFLGHQSKSIVAKKLREAEALIFPSICLEGLPNTIIESYSAGTPVIVSDNPNLRQVVKEGLTGIFFRAGCSDSLIETLMSVNTRLLQEFGMKAREMYLSEYTHDINYNRLIQIYKSLMFKHKAS